MYFDTAPPPQLCYIGLLATILKLLQPGTLRVAVATSWLRASATFEVARIVRLDFLVA